MSSMTDVWRFLSRPARSHDYEAMNKLAACPELDVRFLFAVVLPSLFCTRAEKSWSYSGSGYRQGWDDDTVREHLSNLEKKKKRTAFVLRWLSGGAQRVPALSQLCAQRIAYALIKDALALVRRAEDEYTSSSYAERMALIAGVQCMVKYECDLHSLPCQNDVSTHNSKFLGTVTLHDEYDEYANIANVIVNEILVAVVVWELYSDLRNNWGPYDRLCNFQDLVFTEEFRPNGNVARNVPRHPITTISPAAWWMREGLPYLCNMIKKRGRGSLAGTMMLSSSIAKGLSVTGLRRNYGIGTTPASETDGVILATSLVLGRVGFHPLDYLALYATHALLGCARYNATALDRSFTPIMRRELSQLCELNGVTFAATPYNDAATNLVFGNTPSVSLRGVSCYGSSPLHGITTTRTVLGSTGFLSIATPSVGNLLAECSYYVNSALDKRSLPDKTCYPSMSTSAHLLLDEKATQEQILVQAFLSPRARVLDLQGNSNVTEGDLCLALMGMPAVTDIYTHGTSFDISALTLASTVRVHKTRHTCTYARPNVPERRVRRRLFH